MAAEFTPYTLSAPTVPAVPLVCDSPHSGTSYPRDYAHAAPRELLRRGEDTHVEALWEAVPAVGGTLVHAHFPRTYIDCNRDENDLDPGLLDAPWPTPLDPGPKTRLGFGLVWSKVRRDLPIYDRPLTVAEVRNRIESYYRPYHAAVANAIEENAQRFGGVWHLNLHSMPNDAYERLGIQSPHPLADFVLGDRDGKTCEPGLVDLVERELRGRGYTVARNDPYKGVQLIERIGQPARNRHSLQVEIRRPLYMDEATRERNAGFVQVQKDLTELLESLAAYVKDKVR